MPFVLLEFLEQVDCVSHYADRDQLARVPSLQRALDGGIERRRLDVEVALLESTLNARSIDFRDQRGRFIHRRRERLRAAHPAQTSGDDQFSAKRIVEARLCYRREALVRPLQNSLGSNVNPRAGRHLSVHREPEGVETAEFVPGGPMRDEVRVGDEHARRILMRLENADRFTRRDEHRLVVLQSFECRDERVEAFPIARRLSDPAIDDELLGTLGDLRIEIVHQHPKRRFLLPSAARDFRAARRANDASGIDRCGHARMV